MTFAVMVATGACQTDPSSIPGGLRMDLLQAFVMLAETRHFAGAATRLFLTQSGLSRRIVCLESLVGTPLVRRTTRTVELTAAGETLLPFAARLLEVGQEAVAAARDRSAASERASSSLQQTAASPRRKVSRQ